MVPTTDRVQWNLWKCPRANDGDESDQARIRVASMMQRVRTQDWTSLFIGNFLRYSVKPFFHDDANTSKPGSVGI